MNASMMTTPEEYTARYGHLTDPSDIEEAQMTLSFSASGSADYVKEQIAKQIEAQLASPTPDEHKTAVAAAIIAYANKAVEGAATVSVSGSLYVTVSR